MSDHLETSATCDVCRRPIVPIVDQPGEVECSDFCYRATAAERLAFAEMKPGDFGCWPCSECGCIVEDEFPGPEGTCSSCAPTRRIRVLEAECNALRSALILVADLQLRRYDDALAVRAIRETANDLSAPFSDERATARLEEMRSKR